jgi:formate dehydrogenase major subunit
MDKDLSRREFLKLSGLTSSGLLFGGSIAPKASTPKFRLRKELGETTTICPYCAVGCGMIVAAEEGKVVNIEGNPDHPINQAALCSKGASLSGMVNSTERITKPKYRAPGASEWQEVEWDWALDEIASRVKNTRDEYWIETDGDGKTVRRIEAIASVGSAALDNEECILLVKAMRALGLVYIEHQARI